MTPEQRLREAGERVVDVIRAKNGSTRGAISSNTPWPSVGIYWAAAAIACATCCTLVFRERIGVDRTEHPIEPRDFVPSLFESELVDERPQHVRAGDADVILVRSDGRLYAYGEHCPHLGAPLSDGWLLDGGIVCPWHGARFELTTGSTVKGPATSPLTRFETCVRDGRIEVRLLAPEHETVPRTTARQR